MIKSFSNMCNALHKVRMQLLEKESAAELRVVVSPQVYHEWMSMSGAVSPVEYELHTHGTVMDCVVDVARPAHSTPQARAQWNIVQVIV